MLQEGALQYKRLKKRLFLQLLRGVGIGSRIHWHATDQQEAADIRLHFPAAKQISIIPNIPETEQPPFEVLSKSPGHLRMVFISRISPKKNLDYLLEALMYVNGAVHFDIVGPVEDESYWEKCRHLIDKLPPGIQIKVHGSLNRIEISQILKKNHIFVLPTQGENFGHAIFEALLYGKPVVISHLTPWKDVETDGTGKLVELDAPHQLAEQISSYVQLSEAAYARASKAAWNYARRYLQKAVPLDQYISMFH